MRDKNDGIGSRFSDDKEAYERSLSRIERTLEQVIFQSSQTHLFIRIGEIGNIDLIDRSGALIHNAHSIIAGDKGS